MSIEICMPSLDASMNKARVVKWLKAEGDIVDAGDAVVEIETDKAVVEVEAEGKGFLGKPLVAEGDYADVNTVICVLFEEGEKATSFPDPSFEIQADTDKMVAEEKVILSKNATDTSVLVRPALAAKERIFASPLARRLANIEGIALETLSGSGPNGRIVKCDIEAVILSGKAVQQEVVNPRGKPNRENLAFMPNYQVLKINAMRQTIAQRLTTSSQQVPHYFLNIDCELDQLMRVRKELNADKTPDAKLSINDFIIRSVAYAMRKVPAANVMWDEDAILQFNQVDIAVAVSVDGGLITPVVRDAGNKGVYRISQEVKELAAKARAGKLLPKEYQGGTFTISNLGMYGIKSFTSIINPPQAAILSVGAGEPRPVVRDGELAIATVMTVTLAADHRCIDGAVGAEFLAAFKRFIEVPITMLVAEG